MAKEVDISATYLSKLERDEFPPPAEGKVKAIAKILDCDPDRLLGLAGKVPSDVTEIIKRQPEQFSGLLRAARNLKPSEIEELIRSVQRKKGG